MESLEKMLQLKDIKKDYPVAGEAVHALKGVSLNFRKNEFVSILGASGCGKTTLLNIIGGLDKYTSGDLIINGVSTKQYTDRDWDTYRNHSIGFIFQSYHLIPHQTILQNVELALTISGVDKEERRRRAIEALDKVGLKDRIHNRPNQLSGGQAQRVAIARALINDPEIVLADEPTGALDSKTSVQIMELLKEISKDRLVIMVTHNPELAEQYSTRIIRLLDGLVVDDTKPFDGVEEAAAGQQPERLPEQTTNKGKKKKSSMSFGMAFMLSLKNLLSKAKRTTMVAFAGSIGIIGVSLVLAISSGVQGYIKSMEDDMLSGYPLTVTETAIDFNALMDFANMSGTKVDIDKLKDKVYVDSLLETLMNFNSTTVTNVITQDYKDYVDAMPKDYYNSLQYGFSFDMSNYIYTDFKHKVPSGEEVTENVSVTGIRAIYSSVLGEQPDYADYAPMISTVDSFDEIPDNYNYILSQYDILASYNGKTENLTEAEIKDIFENKDSLIMVIHDNSFSDLNFGQYGYMTQDEFLNFAYKAQGGEYDQSIIDKYNGKYENGKWDDNLKGTDFSLFVGENAKTFKWYPNDTIFTKPAATDIFTIETAAGKQEILGAMLPFKYNPNSENFDKSNGVDLKVKVILQKKEGISYGCLSSGMYHTKALTQHTINSSLNSNIAKHINEKGALQWLPYNYSYTYPTPEDSSVLVTVPRTTYYIFNAGSMMSMGGGGGNALEITAGMVAANELPSSFKIYPLNFESKDLVTEYLDKWNAACEDGSGTITFTRADGTTAEVTGLEEGDMVKYTDTVGLIIMMVNTMIQMITIALIAFTALSLVVSTVMVGIITYVSVVERIKEIGILRSVGARKKDIKRLFNAETFIIGFAAGLVGIIITYVLSLIINVIVGALTGVFTIAALPIWQAAIMVAISVGLTLISGLIPASAAAKKDPVVALRTE